MQKVLRKGCFFALLRVMQQFSEDETPKFVISDPKNVRGKCDPEQRFEVEF